MSESSPLHAEARLRLGRIRFVLVETSLSGNIGAVARAMKNMGLSRMELVRPRQLPDAEALARASGADDLLANAGVHAHLTDALAGCRLVVGSSARLRSVEWPQVEPEGCARTLIQEAGSGDVALLLGRERSGLTNEELSLCHYLVHIPTNPEFSSLNIAAAAQVFAYSLFRAATTPETLGTPIRDPLDPAQLLGERTLATARSDLASPDEMDGFYGHLMQTLVKIGYADPKQSGRLQMRLKRLFNRARLDRTELNILRGVLSAAEGRKRPGRFQRNEAVSEKTADEDDASN